MNSFAHKRVTLVLLSGIYFVTGILWAEESHDQMTVSELEERRDTIKAELDQLALFSLRTGALGTSGYRSFPQSSPDIEGEWIRIDLQEEAALDEIVLVPTLWRYNDEEGYHSDGFPEAFSIIAGTENDPDGELVASYDASDRLLPRVAPVVIPMRGVRASWIRIVPTKLSLRERDWKYIFQLSEVLVFSEEENVALHKPVTCASDVPRNSGIWKPELIVDGSMPYLMDSAQGVEGSAHFRELSEHPAITLDLEEEYLISAINLHAAYQSKSAPPEFNVNIGIPKVITVEGATQPDFSDSTVLLKHKFKDNGEFAPILKWNTPKTICRYIRILGDSAADQGSELSGYEGSNKIGFAEIEILSAGENVAYRKGAIKGIDSGINEPGLAKLTDGYNFYGRILPIRTWMNQLARRHDLEAELVIVSAQLGIRYDGQQATLSILKRVTIALVILVALTMLIGRHLRMRQAARMRERFTADLHDHLGATLHAIGILGSHTKDILDSPDKLSKTLDEIGLMTTRANEATRDFCNQQMAKEPHEYLLADLKRTAGRMIANLDYTFTVEGEKFLQKLRPRARSDFFLFFKECLINVNRHADATEVNILIHADPRYIELSISDNGRGFHDAEQGVVPPSLARRARFLGSKVNIETPESGGLRISLKLKNRLKYFPNLLKTKR